MALKRRDTLPGLRPGPSLAAGMGEGLRLRRYPQGPPLSALGCWGHSMASPRTPKSYGIFYLKGVSENRLSSPPFFYPDRGRDLPRVTQPGGSTADSTGAGLPAQGSFLPIVPILLSPRALPPQSTEGPSGIFLLGSASISLSSPSSPQGQGSPQRHLWLVLVLQQS